MARLLRHRPAPRFLGAWADPPRAPRGVAIPPESILWHVRPRSDSASGGVVRVGPEGRGDEADTLEPGAEVQPLVGKEGVRQLGAGRQLARAWQRESERTLIVRPLQRGAAGRDGKPVVGTKPVVDKVDASAGSADHHVIEGEDTAVVAGTALEVCMPLRACDVVARGEDLAVTKVRAAAGDGGDGDDERGAVCGPQVALPVRVDDNLDLAPRAVPGDELQPRLVVGLRGAAHCPARVLPPRGLAVDRDRPHAACRVVACEQRTPAPLQVAG
mmetsp:Transcript_4002/g.11983  ORF Transcript_4002/g.11983 Transcript_4002/m.11983 type:complete len:272 (+) Transcript_4002:133-948(+)